MTVDWKKKLLPNLPYLLFVYLFDKLCQAVRLAPGLDEMCIRDRDLSAWASWARAKADWYDPTIAKEDELLGKREHEKSQELSLIHI